MKEIILGISAFYHDSAASIVIDGKVVAAAQEERFTRIKGDKSFPHNAINCCLNEAGICFDEITKIVFYENHLAKFHRIMYTNHVNAPFGIRSFLAAMPKWITKNLWLENEIKKELNTKKRIYFVDHHISHAASAFFPSPYEKAAILTIDGVGEWATTTYGIGNNSSIKLMKQMSYPNSVGLFYSAFTYYLGFKINSGEYKVMGLAPYGKPIYTDLIKKELIKIHDDGSVTLNEKYFTFSRSLTMCSKKLCDLFGLEVRKKKSEITKKHMDIAASLQCVINEIVLKLADHVYKETMCENLVLAGGVALNVVAIGMLKRKSKFKNIWVQPASGDAGGSLGCALYCYYKENERIVNKEDSMNGAFLGTCIKDKDENIDKILIDMGASFAILDEESLVENIAKVINEDKIIGIARGKMEFGPRALGHRSILGNAQNLENQKILNLKIKKRESFRPFAPMVLIEDAKIYFEIKDESPYMLSTYYINKKERKTNVKKLHGFDMLNVKRSSIPAVTHIDYSARVQTIDKSRNLFMYRVLSRYKEKTGCSVIINTSFNVRGEPIVNDEIDAFKCFMNTDMDYAVIGNRYFDKKKQDHVKYREKFKKGESYDD